MAPYLSTDDLLTLYGLAGQLVDELAPYGQDVDAQDDTDVTRQVRRTITELREIQYRCRKATP